MSRGLVSVLKNPAVKGVLKAYRLIKKFQRAGSPYEMLRDVFRDAPEEVRKIAFTVIDIASEVAREPNRDPEELAREIGRALGLTDEQVEEFVDTVVPLAEMIADMFKKEEKFITSEETESSTEKQKPGLGEM
jgi:hypothetical protein